jgi:hypothetical protein
MPGNENGSPILRFDIYASENADTLYSYIGSSTESSYTANNLTMGNNYRFKVVAVNFAGQGPYSTESLFMIAATYPDPPINLAKLYADRAFITIMWSAPIFDGGNSVYGYKVLWDAG